MDVRFPEHFICMLLFPHQFLLKDRTWFNRVRKSVWCGELFICSRNVIDVNLLTFSTQQHTYTNTL